MCVRTAFRAVADPAGIYDTGGSDPVLWIFNPSVWTKPQCWTLSGMRCVTLFPPNRALNGGERNGENKGKTAEEKRKIHAGADRSQDLTKYGLETQKGELLFYLVGPTNISVLSRVNIEIKTAPDDGAVSHPGY